MDSCATPLFSPGDTLPDTMPTTDIVLDRSFYSMPNDSVPSDWNNLFKTSDMEDVSLFSSNTTSISVSSTGNSKTACNCHTRAVKLYELVEVELVWAWKQQRDDAFSMLHHQKRIMTDCESLLDCRQCVPDSALSLLVVSMLHKLVRSLEGTSRQLKPQPEQSDRDSSLLKQYDSTSQSASGYSSQKQHLDEEDYQAALGSVFAKRASKLLSLLTRAERLAVNQNWMGHKAMLQLLIHRLRAVQEQVVIWNIQNQQVSC